MITDLNRRLHVSLCNMSIDIRIVVEFCLITLTHRKSNDIFLGEYDQNKCDPNDPTCQPCPDRLPSCVGLPNGYQPMLNYRWTDKFMECQMNRTIQITRCSPGWVFNPFTNTCVKYIEQSKLVMHSNIFEKILNAHSLYILLFQVVFDNVVS